jgi:Transposase DDE domain
VTTLLDAKVYGVADLAELYRRRWQVETPLAHLKTTMHMDVLHCKSVSGVLKELTIFAMVYNPVRQVMRQSATLQHTAVERSSLLDAPRWLSAPSTSRPLQRFSDQCKAPWYLQAPSWPLLCPYPALSLWERAG